jgi:polar amino acid transport system substrate-binding protein
VLNLASVLQISAHSSRGIAAGGRFVIGIASAAALMAIVGAGCGVTNREEGTLTSARVGVRPDPTLAAHVPAQIRSKQVLIIAEDATYAPDEFVASNGNTVIGMDADLGKAIAERMGLRPSIQNVPFDSIIAGLNAGKYSLGMSSFSDTKARQAVIDFVTYAIAGESFYVRAPGGPDIASLADLCGHSVAAEKGTTEAADAVTQSTRCTMAGKRAVSVGIFPDQNYVNAALAARRVQVAFADTPVAAYAVRQSGGRFRLIPGSIANAPYGIAIAKHSGLQQTVLGAVKTLIADGTYGAILRYWGLQRIGIRNPAINAATQ